MKSRRKIIIGIAVLGLIGLGVVAVWHGPRYLVSREPHPIKNCTFQFMFESYLFPNGWSTAREREEPILEYPNTAGKSEDSLMQAFTNVFERFVDPILDAYGYVPGLRTHDPDDLIMLYLKKPTKLESGKQIKSYLRVLMRSRKWAVLPHYIEEGHTDNPILLSTSEFKSRLKKTLEFLKENNRPNWENVVKEHTEFLNSIKD